MELTDEFERYRNEGQDEPSDEKKDIVHHERIGTARTISFIQISGEETFLNYAYLISGYFHPEKGIISILFTTHEIILKGHNLQSLMEPLKSQTVKEIREVDERYAEIYKEDKALVYSISVIDRVK